MIKSFIIQQQLRIGRVSVSLLQICCSPTFEILMTRRRLVISIVWAATGPRQDMTRVRAAWQCDSRPCRLVHTSEIPGVTNDSRDPVSEAVSPLIDTTCHVSRSHVSVISSYIYHPPVSSDAGLMPGPSLAQHLLIMARDELFSSNTLIDTWLDIIK